MDQVKLILSDKFKHFKKMFPRGNNSKFSSDEIIKFLVETPLDDFPLYEREDMLNVEMDVDGKIEKIAKRCGLNIYIPKSHKKQDEFSGKLPEVPDNGRYPGWLKPMEVGINIHTSIIFDDPYLDCEGEKIRNEIIGCFEEIHFIEYNKRIGAGEIEHTDSYIIKCGERYTITLGALYTFLHKKYRELIVGNGVDTLYQFFKQKSCGRKKGSINTQFK